MQAMRGIAPGADIVPIDMKPIEGTQEHVSQRLVKSLESRPAIDRQFNRFYPRSSRADWEHFGLSGMAPFSSIPAAVRVKSAGRWNRI